MSLDLGLCLICPYEPRVGYRLHHNGSDTVGLGNSCLRFFFLLSTESCSYGALVSQFDAGVLWKRTIWKVQVLFGRWETSPGGSIFTFVVSI